MKAGTLRTRKEKNLFAVCMILSIVLWLMLLVSILGVFYGLFFGIMAAIAIPQFKHYRAKARANAAVTIPSAAANLNAADGAPAQAQAMDIVLNEGYRLARDYSARNGKWPCSLEELGSQQAVQLADSNGWEMDIDCDRNYIALYYLQDGSTWYRALLLDTGNIESGMAE